MNFDRVIDRRGTHSIKWDNPKNDSGSPDIIPLWVADMDFSPPEAVIEAIRGRAGHPIFGYTSSGPEYAEAVSDWYAARQGLAIPPEEILMAPSVMPSLAAMLQAFTEKGDAVMILPPVYHPFFSMPEENDRLVVTASLARGDDGAWSMDFGAMERAAAKAEASGRRLSALVFSSPHNPVGRVWTEAELDRLLDFTRKRGMALICDEIHSDIILGERPFRSMASVTGERARKLVVLSGPNKTFNIAGLHISQVIARDGETRSRAKRALSAWGFGPPNVFSLAAAVAAYREGGPWLDALIAYLKGNYSYLLDFFAEKLPGIGVSQLEGSYLAWLDLRGVLGGRGEGGSELPIANRLEDEGRVKLNPGSLFGDEGKGYMRLNLACPRSILAEGLERMARIMH